MSIALDGMLPPERHTAKTVQEWLGYLFPDEVVALKELVCGLPINPVVVNIGAGGATSSLCFIESRDDVSLYTIDIQDESSPFGCLQAERTMFESAGYAHLLGTRWSQIHDDSKAVGRTWNAGKVDLVFVDGGHEYEECAGDILAWMPNLKSDGIIAVHDYRKHEAQWPDDGKRRPHPLPHPGVDQAVDELLLGRYPEVLRVDSLIAFRKSSTV